MVQILVIWIRVFKIKTKLNLTIIITWSHLSFQTYFHVINKNTGKAVSTRFYGDALVVFHHINAYEEDGHVVFDIIAYKDSNLYDMFYLHNIRQETKSFIEKNKLFSPPVCQRFVLPLNVQKVQFNWEITSKCTNITFPFTIIAWLSCRSPPKELTLWHYLTLQLRHWCRRMGPSTVSQTYFLKVFFFFQKIKYKLYEIQYKNSLFSKTNVFYSSTGLELPGINYNFNTRKYRYFYGSRLEWSPHPNKVKDVREKITKNSWSKTF